MMFTPYPLHLDESSMEIYPLHIEETRVLRLNEIGGTQLGRNAFRGMTSGWDFFEFNLAMWGSNIWNFLRFSLVTSSTKTGQVWGQNVENFV